MPSDLQRLVEFACRWYRYGGGTDEDIFVTFGLTEREYFRRLDRALSTQETATGLDPAAIAAIKQLCKRRLAQA